jgi:hypothetical protein
MNGSQSIFSNSLSQLQKINKLFVNSINNLSSFELSNLSGSTSNLQQQINSINTGNSEQVIINENAIAALENRAYEDEQNITELEIKTQNMNVDDTITIFSGPVNVVSLNGISSTLISYLSGVTSNIQTQLNALPTSVNFTNMNNEIEIIQNTISNMLYVDNTTIFNSSSFYVNGNMTLTGNLNGISPTIINFLSGLTGNIQEQLNASATDENFTNMNNEINSILTRITGLSFIPSSSSTTQFNTNVNVLGTLNGIPNNIYQYLSNCREDIQYAIDHAYTTVSIGSVTNINYGQNAYVNNTGSTKTAILNFGIPGGRDGIDSIQPSFSVGTVQNSTSPSVTLTGTQTNPILNFTFEKGDDGISAIQPTFEIGSVVNGNEPSVTINETSTDTNIVLDFVLQQGSRGPQGDSIKGDTGERGERGQDGSDGDSSAATAASIASAASAGVASAAAIGSAASASASAISAASALGAVAAIQTEVNALNTQVQSIQTEVTLLNTDVDALQLKTSAQSNNGVSTIFNNVLEGSSLVSNSDLYVPNNATVLGNLYVSNITSLTEISINAPTISLNGISINLNGFVNDGFSMQGGFFNQFGA